MLRKVFALPVVALAFALSACGTGTSITGSWKAEGVQPQEYQKVAVLAITQDPGRRRTVESQVAQALAKQRVEAIQANSVLADEFLQSQPAREDIQSKLEAAGIDGLLTIALLDAKEETRYVPGSTYYTPAYPYYRGYYPYYSHWSPVVYDPGYYTQSTSFFLESNLYRVADGELVWSGQSKTVDPSSITNFANSYSGAMVKQMIKDGVLTR